MYSYGFPLGEKKGNEVQKRSKMMSLSMQENSYFSIFCYIHKI